LNIHSNDRGARGMSTVTSFGTIQPAAAPVSKALLTANQEQRRGQLIQATIRIIAGHGLSNTTLAKVAQDAGLSPGIVNFYFTSKDQLLLAVLKTLSDEFMAKLEAAIAASGSDPGANLEALTEAMLAPDLSDPDKVAVWYAFWGEARARSDYLKACGERDEAYHKALLALCRQLGEAAPQGHPIDPEAVTLALLGLLDQFWQEIMARRGDFDRRNARRLCAGFLASVFPWRFALPAVETAENQPPQQTLPAWTYGNAEFFQLERERLFRRAWNVVGHVSDLPNPGDYLTFELLGERAFVMRGKDGQLRAFHNVCRHRAHAVVSGEQGACAGVIRCPYHGWLYNLDGRLRAVAAEKSFAGMEKGDLGLLPVELEVFQGFLFVRFEGGEPSVAERFQPYAEELAPYRSLEMRPLWAPWSKELEVDWKNVLDNYLEGYHVPASHPGLFDLFGGHYEVEAQATGVGRALHWIRPEGARGWSQRAYQRLLPRVEHLPVERQRAWAYYSLFPLTSFDLYPDSIDFFQVIPLDSGRTLLRARSYALPGAGRDLKAARWLQARINSQVQREDEDLTRSVQGGLASSAYQVGVLSEKEAMLTAFHDWVRQRLPVARQVQVPAEGTVAALNAALEG
jgi:phenylpropionate dioxygenase-like ring-hydroxylating dioxygenase large terminal subunit/AcrR family transcriptional regulator